MFNPTPRFVVISYHQRWLLFSTARSERVSVFALFPVGPSQSSVVCRKERWGSGQPFSVFSRTLASRCTYRRGSLLGFSS